MQTFTYQSKHFGMMGKIVTVVLLHLTILVGVEVITVVPAGAGSVYNVSASVSSISDGTGGFNISIAGASTYLANDGSADVYYHLWCSPDEVNYFRVTGGTGLGNTSMDNFGNISISEGTIIEVSCNETRFASGWPGDDGEITIKLKNLLNVYVGNSNKFTVDLTQPTAGSGDLSASIYSNNSVNPGTGDEDNLEYAITGNTITIRFYSDEELLQSGIAGSVSGVTLTSVTGSGQLWYANSTVATQADGVATYNITYQDLNGNSGTSSISTTTDGSTVIIDQTDPTVGVSISSSNATNSLAKINDIVTIDVSSDEILYLAPTTSIDGNSVTPNPNAPSATYSIARTMESGDTQGVVALAVNNIIDRAGNTITNIDEATDGSSVTFDSNAPTLTGLTIATDNDLDPTLAMPGDVVTLTFYTSHPAQLPEVTVLTVPALVTNASDDQLTWSATHTMTALDPAGVVAFTIDYKDLAGNPGDQEIAIMSGSNITYDKVDPGIDGVVVESTNIDYPTLAKSGEWISVEITADESLSSITGATIGGNAITGNAISEVSPTIWKLSYQVQAGDPDGSVAYAFTAVDLAGNTTDVTAAGSAVTIDNTAPTLTFVGILSSSSTNTAYAKVGDDVTLTITSDEDLAAAPTVFIAGIAVTPDINSTTSYEAELTMLSGYTQTDAPMAISIVFSDVVGNSGTEVIATNNSSSVIFDKTVPALGEVTISTNNDNSAYAKEGDIITLGFTAANTENLLANPTVTILTEAATVSGSGASWTATYFAATGDAEGTVPFTIEFSDYAGNEVKDDDAVSAITDGNDVIFDETIPTLPSVSITSSNTNAPSGTLATFGDDITLSITADDNIQEPTITIADNEPVSTTGTTGESVYTATYQMQSGDPGLEGEDIEFTVDFSDLAGNAGAQVVALTDDDANGGVSWDEDAPVFTVVSIKSNNEVSEATTDDDYTYAKVGDLITVDLTSGEDLQVGLDPTVTIAGNAADVTRDTPSTFRAVYQMDSSDEDNVNADGTIPINISDYKDPTGNDGDPVTATLDESSVIFDMTDPDLGTVTIASGNVYSNWAKVGDLITLTFASTEDLDSDDEAPVVSILGSTADVTLIPGADAKSWSATKLVEGGSPQGVAAFSIIYQDLVGNYGDAYTTIKNDADGKSVTVDRGVPTIITASIASNNENGADLAVPGDEITLDVIAFEDIIEPTITIATQTATVTDEGDDDGATWQGVYTMTVADENGADGNIPFVITFSDSAGNAGTNRTTIANDVDGNNVSYDKTKPTFSNVTISSDNTGNNQYARAGSIITLSFDTSEPLLSTAVTINDAEESASLSGSSYTIVHTITNATGDNGGAGYAVPFTIDATDLNGYDADQVTETLDETNITFDKTTPSIDDLILTSSNANAALARVGDVLTLELVAFEVLQQPTFSIAGETNITEEAGATDASWSGTYTMKATDIEGDQAIQVDFMDYAGNSVATTTETSDGSAVRFDRTLPTLDVVTIVSDNDNNQAATTGNTLTLSIEASEDLKTAPMFTIAGGAAFAATVGAAATDWSGTYIMQAGDTEGVVEFSISFEDLAANPGDPVDATEDETSVTFDKTATDISSVVLDLVDGSDSGVSNSDDLTNDQTLEFQITGLRPNGAGTATDAVGDSIFFYVDGVQTDLLDGTKGGVPISGNLSLVLSSLSHQELAYEVKVVSQDQAGNTSTFSTPIDIRIDTEAGSVSAPNLSSGSDLGFLDDDDITNDQQPIFYIFSGSSTVRDSVRLFYNIGASDVLVGGFRKPDNG